jgi:Uncharacterized protein conserved in bacteria (DUF2213)
MDDITNAKEMPKIFYCRHFQAGIVGYQDETVLVDTDAIINMLPSAVGKPVYVYHQAVDMGNLKAEAAGYITDAFYNEKDGWGWFKFIVVDDEAHSAIRKGWRVSNAYTPSRFAGSGTKNNIPYDREILDGEFTHLAIVPDPRYEDAKIFTPDEFKAYQAEKHKSITEIHNSKTNQKDKPMLKFFKTKKEEVAADDIDSDTMVELSDGQTVSVTEMVNALTADKKAKQAPATVEVDGERMLVSDLVKKFELLNAKAKKNEDDAVDDDESDAKENAEDEEDEKTNEEDEADSMKEKKNQKHFDDLKNARDNAPAPIQTVDVASDRLARGTARYSK